MKAYILLNIQSNSCDTVTCIRVDNITVYIAQVNLSSNTYPAKAIYLVLKTLDPNQLA